MVAYADGVNPPNPPEQTAAGPALGKHHQNVHHGFFSAPAPFPASGGDTS